MTQKVHLSFDRRIRNREVSAAIQYGGGSDGWISEAGNRLVEDSEIISARHLGERGREVTPALRYWAAVALIEDALEQCDGDTVEIVLVG